MPNIYISTHTHTPTHTHTNTVASTSGQHPLLQAAGWDAGQEYRQPHFIVSFCLCCLFFSTSCPPISPHHLCACYSCLVLPPDTCIVTHVAA